MEVEVSLFTLAVVALLTFVVLLFLCRSKQPIVVEEDAPLPDLQFFMLPELVKYNGTNDPKLYVGIRGVVYDVTKGKDFYGPGGAYNCFCGHDASVALAKMSFEKADLESSDLKSLGMMEVDSLNGWEAKFQAKYPVIGIIVKSQAEKAEYEQLQRGAGREAVLKKRG